jgi:hypothetical protein
MTPLLQSVLSVPALFENLSCLQARGAVHVSFDRRGRQSIHHDGITYRLRLWSEEEWAALPKADRPAACAYNAELACWVGLVAALDCYAPDDPSTVAAKTLFQNPRR